MSLNLLRTDVNYRVGYNRHLRANSSIGLCYAMSVDWIMDYLQRRKNIITPPDCTMARILAFQQCSSRVNDLGYTNCHTLEMIGKKACFNSGGAVAYEVMSEKVYFGAYFSHAQMKKKIMNMPGRGNLNVFCLMIWKVSSGGAHAVVAFRNKTDGQTYLFDPNEGVYSWEGGGPSLYHDIKIRLKADFKYDVYLMNCLFITTAIDLNINSRGGLVMNDGHVVI